MKRKYGQLYGQTECYACHCYVHFANKCPYKKPKAINLEMIEVMMIKNGNVINKTWILLDT